MTEPLVRLDAIHKRFGRVTALRGADLLLGPGEVHGVLGENGAGKSTLLGIMAGTLRPDSGTLRVENQVVAFRRPRDAWSVGLGLVHQHFTLVPALSVLENLALGMRGSAGGLRLPYERLRDWVRDLSERTGLRVPLDARVEALGVGSRQRVEILKVLLRRPRVLMLDEPTAVLTPGEVRTLFDLLRSLAAEGRSVVLVSHKLDEVLGVADRVTVLRSGRTVLAAPRSEVDAAALTLAMVGTSAVEPLAVGRAAEGRSPGRGLREPGPVVASLRDVRVRGARGEEALEGVSLEARRGRILGVAGVEGNGQRELAAVLSGRVRPDRGEAALPPGIGFIPQDRTQEGLVAGFDLTANATLALQGVEGFRRGPFLRWTALRERTVGLMDRFDVRAAGPEALAGTLSGGNQQRMVVARELDVATDLLVAENPTRGLDVAATAFVHEELRRMAATDGGPAIVLVSTDLDEVLALSDRVLVMVRGRLTEVPSSDRTRAGVGALMLSGSDA